MISDDAEYRKATEQQVEALRRNTPYHSLRMPDGRVIPGLIGIEALEQRIASFPIPKDLRGCRVLDIGAASGWNSFEMVQRGASVMAVDCVEFEEFTAARSKFNPSPEYKILDVDELTPAAVGTFDFVLFFGVLYHLRHPLLALEKICALTTRTAFIESFVSDPVEAISDACSLEFYETDELGGQIDNWFGPTVKCLQALCRSAGFVRVALEYVSNRRAGVTCHRRWEPPPERPHVSPAWLYSAVNNRTSNIFFHPAKDEYVCIYFRSSEAELNTDRLRIEIDGYGVNALIVVSRGANEWQANARLPSGLTAGEHIVRVRTTATHFGNAFAIHVVDTPFADRSAPGAPQTIQELPASVKKAPVVFLIENSFDRSHVFHGYSAERLCCRFRYFEENLRRERVLASIDDGGGVRQISFLTNLGNGEWEASLSLAPGLGPGHHTIRLRVIDSYWSEPGRFIIE